MRDVPLPTLPLSDLYLPRRARPAPDVAPASNVALARSPEVPRFTVRWAQGQREVREAQRLRHDVFVQEMGARIQPPPGSPAGHDIDMFDPFCEHLVVRTEGTAHRPGGVIGTYRVLTPQAAGRLGGWYSDTEFDLTRLRPLTSRIAELGRSCVHPEHRNGAVIMALWSGLGSFMLRHGLDTVIGCASISMRDGGDVAASLWHQLKQQHLAPIEYQVQPRLALPLDDLRHDLDVDPPALIKGYLRCGAKVLGPPAWDPEFNTADLPLMLRLADLPAKYRRHFLGDATVEA